MAVVIDKDIQPDKRALPPGKMIRTVPMDRDPYTIKKSTIGGHHVLTDQ
jgi:hypothetical protein